MAELLLERHEGEVPGSLEELEALPGVGHKTASVVMVQAFGVPAFPVDTHIHRLAERWRLSDGSNVKRTEEDLKALFPEEEWGALLSGQACFGMDCISDLLNDARSAGLNVTAPVVFES